MGKYYAVRSGLVPGVYNSWADCEKNVKGVPGAIYKSFASLEEAKAFASQEVASVDSNRQQIELPKNYAFTDGSYNCKTKTYGCGGFFMMGKKKFVLQSSGSDIDMSKMRNVAGEILGATMAIEKAKELGVSEFTLFYDYEGVEFFPHGWKPTKTKTIEYAKLVRDAEEAGLKINFVHVKGHAGIPGNEEADRLAKKSVGL